MASRSFTPALFLLPAFLGLVVFHGVPVLLSLGISFTEWNLLQAPQFIGWDNYRELWGDAVFWRGLRLAAAYALLNIPLQTVLGLGLALAMDRLTQALWLKSLVLFPYLLSNVLAALVWMWMLDPVLGLANVLFEAWGVGRQGFFADEDQALMTLAVVNTWKHMGMVALLFLAGLQAIPRSLYEAAALDGASGWQQFWRVTVPLLRPVLVFVWITSVTGSIQLFDTVAVATQGGPLDSTRVVVHHIVDTAFTQYRMGYATAMSWVLLLIMLAFTAVQMRLLRGSSDLG